jgi:hypothetical protein
VYGTFVADGVGVGSATTGLFGVGVEACEDGEDLADGVDVGITTPLSQIKFLPDLIHVYFLPRQTICCPRREHFKVGPVAANAGVNNCKRALMPRTLTSKRRCISGPSQD